MKKIAVLVSGGGTNLQAIIDAVNAGKITNGRLELVISSKPDVFALERADNAGIKSVVVDRKKIEDRKQFTGTIISHLEAHEIDLIVLAGFTVILDGMIFEKYKNRMMNVHPALIPSFCGDGFYGLKVHKAVLEKGVKLTGATVHFVNEITDGGPIIAQKTVPVRENDTPEILQKRVMEEAEWQILSYAVDLFCNDRLTVDENDIVHISD